MINEHSKIQTTVFFHKIFPILHRFPFDVKNPCGYTIAVALEYIFTTNALFMVLCLLGFAFGTCLTLISLAKDITCDVSNFNESARVKDDHSKIVKQFSQLIDFHSDAKQLSRFICRYISKKILLIPN